MFCAPHRRLPRHLHPLFCLPFTLTYPISASPSAATFRALLDHAIAASVGRTAAQLRLNGASTSDSACIEGGGSGGSGSDGGHGSSSLGAVENRGGSPSCSSWRQSPASSASSGRAEASPFKELYGVLWNMKHEARSSGGGSRSSTEEPRQVRACDAAVGGCCCFWCP